MSYIITSNIDVNHRSGMKDPSVVRNGMNKPYSYTNSMDSMVIPANSEIAVASVKVNREGLFTLSQDNNRFALYYGPPNTTLPSSTLGYMEELTQPIFGTIRGESGNPTSTFNTDDFATAVQESMRLFTFHPAYQLSDKNTSGLTVSASRVANEGFKGFNFTTNSYSACLLTNNAASLIAPLIAIDDGGGEYLGKLSPRTSITSLLIENKTSFDKVGIDPAKRAGANIFGNRPISILGGKMTVNITKWNNGSNGSATDGIEEFEIGLTRAQKNRMVYDDTSTNKVSPFPPYFEAFQGSSQGPTGPQMGYYDYVVKNEFRNGIYELRIYQAVNDTTPSSNYSGALTRMVEVDYQSGLPGNARYRVDSLTYSKTTEKIEEIEFEVRNEEMYIRFVDDNDDFTGMEISSGAYTGSTHKNQRLKPVNSMCWNMYPKIRVAGWGGETETTKYSTLNMKTFQGNLLENHQYGGSRKSNRPLYMPVRKDGIYDSMTDFYSYSTSQRSGDIQQNLITEDCVTESINYFDSANNTVVPSQKGLTGVSDFSASKIFADISNVLIMGTSELYANSTQRANTKNILGFPNNDIIVGQFGPAGGYNPANPTEVRTNTSSASLLLSAYVSDSVPKLTSGESSFVRVRNLTTQTFNVANQSFSKILYHIPKFDNSGTEFGSLFFEPGERMYIKLNNLTSLNLNNIDVDLVLGTEIVEQSYTGTTVVCFHIQKSR